MQSLKNYIAVALILGSFAIPAVAGAYVANTGPNSIVTCNYRNDAPSWGYANYRPCDATSFGSTSNNSNTNTQNTQNQSGLSVYTNNIGVVTSSSAVLNGAYQVNNPVASQTYTWFEYGTSQALGYGTAALITGTAFSASVTNLNPNSTYYYRAIAQNGGTVARGDIRSFRTNSSGAVLGTSTSKPASKPAAYSKISLTKTVTNISGNNGNTSLVAASVGDVVRYTLTVNNSGTGVANGVVVIDQFSPALELVASGTNTIFDSVTRTLSWNVGTVGAGEKKSVSFDAKIGTGESIIENIATARGTGITEKNSNKTQVVVASTISGETACATAITGNDKKDSGNVASVASLGGFLPHSAFGWFMTLLLLVLIGILVYRLLKPRETKVVVH